MGTVTVSKQASARLSPAELQDWFEDELRDMAREGGTDSYCGNWNACHGGLNIVNKPFANIKEAQAYAERNLEKNEDVLAMRVGTFPAAWPATKAQREIHDRLQRLRTEANEFDYRILERAQGQKSKTKKCSNCESAINVHKMPKPALAQLKPGAREGMMTGVIHYGNRYMFCNPFGLTDCPVCRQNLLKTETDKKNQESLTKRLAEAEKKAQESRTAHEKDNTSNAFWYVIADCGS